MGKIAKPAVSDKPKRPKRASQRAEFGIDLADRDLRDLMVEQFRYGGGYVTVYKGARADFLAGGIPEGVFPVGDAERSFEFRTLNVCCSGEREKLEGSIKAVSDGFELEVYWGHLQPYTQGGHPAICELARLLLTDVVYWTGKGNPAHAIDAVVKDGRSDYKPSRRHAWPQVTEDFQRKLQNAAHELFMWVHTHGEVIPREVKAPEKRNFLRVVADNTRSDREYAAPCEEASHGKR